MNVEYDIPLRGPYKYEKDLSNDDLERWIYYNIDSGGIESKIEKLIAVVTRLTSKHIIKNPDQLCEFADMIGCRGINHRLTEDDE